jgi:DNA-binding NtrC family response regulator
VIPIRIPPLRERPEDIPLLAEAFLRRHGQGTPPTLSTRAIEKLMRHPWDGNARELENAIERSLVLASGSKIEPQDLALDGVGSPTEAFEDALLADAFRQRMTVRELSERYIDHVLDECGGSKTEAARILGINRRTLYRRDERADDAGEEDEDA